MLHQLRGRVGRGTRESHCLLMYHAPLSQHAHEQLAILRETPDGFKIARRNLELWGPGEVLGTRQTGEMRFRVADLLHPPGPPGCGAADGDVDAEPPPASGGLRNASYATWCVLLASFILPSK